MANIYELTNDFIVLRDLIEDGDTDEQVLMDTMEAISLELEDKADGYIKVIKNLESDIEGLKKEEARLKAKRQSIEKSISRMRENLLNSMVRTGKERFKTQLFSYSVRNSDLVVVQDISLVPKSYIDYGDPKVKKDEVKKLLKMGIVINGVRLETSKSLSVR